MSRETEARAFTVPHALTTALVLEGLNGKTPLVAQEEGVTDLEPFFPNSYSGAQPDTESSTVIFDGVVASYPDTQLLSGIEPEPTLEPESKPEPETIILAPVVEDTPSVFSTPLVMRDNGYFNPIWRARVSHRPNAPQGWLVNPKSRSDGRYYPKTPRTPIEGELIKNTVEGEMPVAEQPSTKQPAAGNIRSKWADIKAYVGVKLRPELWSSRARTVTVIGGLAATAAGVVMTAYGAKHGVHIPFLNSNQESNPDTTAPHDMSVQPGHLSTPDTAIPSPEQTPDTTPTPALEQPPQEHFRTAVGYDEDTNRASNVHDWSVDALRDAGKDAGLSHSQIDHLTHDRHNIDRINSAFYGENKQVANDSNHYLYAHTKYTTTDQETTAHNIASSWKSENEPATDTTTTTELPKPETGLAVDKTDTTSTPQITDEALQKMIDEIENDPQYNPPVVPQLDPLNREGLLGLTEREWMNIRRAVGIIAVATLLPTVGYQTKRSREKRLIQERNSIDWGTNGYGQKLKNHRNLRRKPTVPFGKSARKHWVS